MDTPVTGTPRLLLRLEGLCVLIAAAFAYHLAGASWLLFAILILAPDIAMLGYLAGPGRGAALYNAVHTYAGPAILAAIGHFGEFPTLLPLCLIWTAHIGMDRAVLLGDGASLDVRAALGAAGVASAPAAVGQATPADASHIEPLDAVVIRHIERALEATRGRVEGPRGAARLLRLNPHTLRSRMRKLRVDWQRFRDGGA